MSEQREKILKSVEHIKKDFPKSFKPKCALILDEHISISKEYGTLCDFHYDTIPPFHENDLYKQKGYISCGKFYQKDIIILKGRFNFHDGIPMRDIGHVIYLLKYLGIEDVLAIDEVASVNPRYRAGELALVYDHINLTGDNPLIGVNDAELGVRFPDMSNAYEKDLFGRIYNVMQDKKVRINESVYLASIGPGSETDAEAHFYREIGSDVVGYSLAGENIAAVHAGLKFAGIGLITRELIADKMREDERSSKQIEKDKKDALKKCEEELDKVLKDIIKIL